MEGKRELTATQLVLVKETMAATTGASMEGLDAERQRLWHIHHGQVAGYDADQRALAGELAASLEQTMRQHVPVYGEYLDKHAEASKPLQPFVKEFVGDIPAEHVDKIELPSGEELVRRVFASRSSFENFRKMLGDEEAFKDARAYTATALNAIVKSNRGYWAETVSYRALDEWVSKNAWIDDVPGLKDSVGKVRVELRRIYTSRIVFIVLFGLVVATVVIYLVSRTS